MIGKGRIVCWYISKTSLPSLKLTARTWKWIVGRLSRFLLGWRNLAGVFAVSFREGISLSFLQSPFPNLRLTKPCLQDVYQCFMAIVTFQWDGSKRLYLFCFFFFGGGGWGEREIIKHPSQSGLLLYTVRGPEKKSCKWVFLSSKPYLTRRTTKEHIHISKQ